jgi:hypothetical protein
LFYDLKFWKSGQGAIIGHERKGPVFLNARADFLQGSDIFLRFRLLVTTARTFAGIPAALIIHASAGPPVNPATAHVSLSILTLLQSYGIATSQLIPVGHARREGRFAKQTPPPRSVPFSHRSETKEARQTCRGKHNAKRLQKECFLRSKSDWGTGQRPVNSCCLSFLKWDKSGEILVKQLVVFF